MRLRAAVLVILLAAAAARAGPAPEARVMPIDLPEHGFYAKQIDYRGIPIKAHACVADEALLVARDRLDRLLGRLDAAAENLRDAGVELHIIGAAQVTSDLPEHRHMKGKPFDGQLTIDERTRGVGGQYVSCGEENLLGLPGDRYAGRDICSHEFAHALLTYGLSADVRDRIEAQFRRSVGKGLWKGAYAATNVQEYFAELTMWYVGTHGDLGMDPKPGIGPGGLRRYDPEGFALLDDLYGGRIAVGRTRFVPLAAQPPAKEAELRSADGPDTAVRFHNQTPRQVQLFWLDDQGKRRPYGTLDPGERRDQQTFATHVWLAADPDGRGLAVFVAGPEPGLADIKGP
ncbi:MAG: hypothetical protein IMZ66_07310 [Planctomycetes bacterium]|nr:hypothetical protein [Planctomycetota bacterium]